MSKRISFTVNGTVQGVNFRSWTEDKARGLGLTGYVMNDVQSSTKVFGEAQGTSSALEKFVQHLNIGPRMAKVDKVDQQDIESKDGESSFNQTE